MENSDISKMEDASIDKFEVSRFDPPPPEDLFCQICWRVFEKPVELRCGHGFCEKCIQTWAIERGSSTCPVCRNNVTPSTLKKPSRILNNIVNKLTMKCPRGCAKKLFLENFDEHVKICKKKDNKVQTGSRIPVRVTSNLRRGPAVKDQRNGQLGGFSGMSYQGLKGSARGRGPTSAMVSSTSRGRGPTSSMASSTSRGRGPTSAMPSFTLRGRAPTSSMTSSTSRGRGPTSTAGLR